MISAAAWTRRLVLAAAPALLLPRAARAQEPGRVYRLGGLSPNPRDFGAIAFLFDGLRRLGFIEGQNLALDPRGFARNHLGQALVEERNIRLQTCQTALTEPAQHGVLEMARLIFGGDMLLAELAPHRDDLGKPFGCRVTLRRARRHDRDVFRDQPRIEPIVLRQHPACTGELTQLVRVDASHREAGCEQGTDDATLIATAGLQADRGDHASLQSADQIGPTGRVIGNDKTLPTRPDRHIQTIHRNVDTDSVRFAHLRTPSLLMRARALATVRVWKRWLEHQAHSRSDSLDAHGLPAMTGAGS